MIFMFVSICTPTYNRAYTLSRLYESLLEQTDKDFEWVVVADGSTDNTKEIVQEWSDEGKILINYIYQSNQGKHVALNKGMEVARGILFTCLDSDDWFYHNAVQIVREKWTEKPNEEIAGIIALDTYENKS